jgi:hypothetical protein
MPTAPIPILFPIRLFSLSPPHSSRRRTHKTREIVIEGPRKVPPTGIIHTGEEIAIGNIAAGSGPEGAEAAAVRADGADLAREVCRDVGAEVEGGDDLVAVAAEVAVGAHVDAALGGEALGEVGGVVVGGGGVSGGGMGGEGGGGGEGEEGEEGGGEEGFHCYSCWERRMRV